MANGADKRTRMLVVDDDPRIRNLLAQYFGGEGFDVDTVSGSSQMRESLAVSPFDVILLDLGMPGFDGFEVCRRLRERPDGARLRVVALTGWGMAQDRQRTAAAGFDLHLVKPVHPQSIVDQLRRWQPVH